MNPDAGPGMRHATRDRPKPKGEFHSICEKDQDVDRFTPRQ